ncbi:glycoside hydrolase family 88 protein [Formosa algae]|uniref:Unsaturated chondroitin disaccharide hydrolase n=1 Tax=Formosa algae TaxID=225843 RepID=A0A9X0YPZ4_9FLAO|nr:glycoside hydrolase family 88 protein [Formosa algae]MBP1841242.1 unsaturated chondroitin disaccharide hydrolase [Formosa algae]MDQ0336835.1 unsaturated chondroitin disaccharide hydrolase [Formosa algae]
MNLLKGTFVACLCAATLIGCDSKKKDVTVSSVNETAEIVHTDRIADLSVEKVKTTLAYLTVADSFPRNISQGQKDWNLVGVTDWCSGFWPGVLWYAYELSDDPEIKAGAEKFTAPLKEIAYSPADNHDIGFMVYCSYGNGYRLTGNEEYKTVMLAAADTLATLYNPKVGTILSWPVMVPKIGYNTIIDNMMNLELLFWAAKNGGDKSLYDLADSHAEKSMQYLVRPDYSIYHVALFDEKTGKFKKGITHQGYADDSMWARGQGWGIYGFAMSYRETGKEAYLDTSIKLADHFLERLPEDGIPYWDFDDPKIPDAPKDASAASLIACGMLELADQVKDKDLKEKYTNAAKSLMEKLESDTYFSGDTNEALLLHSTGHLPNNSEIDVPIIYADYYFMEALLRLEKLEQNIAQN